MADGPWTGHGCEGGCRLPAATALPDASHPARQRSAPIAAIAIARRIQLPIPGECRSATPPLVDWTGCTVSVRLGVHDPRPAHAHAQHTHPPKLPLLSSPARHAATSRRGNNSPPSPPSTQEHLLPPCCRPASLSARALPVLSRSAQHTLTVPSCCNPLA
jgi:hypothetical protein